MSITRYSAALAALLVTLPAVSYAEDATIVVSDEVVTDTLVSEDVITEADLEVLTPGERAMHAYRMNYAQTPEQAAAVRAQTRAQVEARMQKRARMQVEEREQQSGEGKAFKTQTKAQKGFLERMMTVASNGGKAGSGNTGSERGGSERSTRDGGNGNSTGGGNSGGGKGGGKGGGRGK